MKTTHTHSLTRNIDTDTNTNTRIQLLAKSNFVEKKVWLHFISFSFVRFSLAVESTATQQQQCFSECVRESMLVCTKVSALSFLVTK